jgi:hypothetical protein
LSEILFIASDPCIVALVEDLQPLLESRINLASDYTSGIKLIFDLHPAVVFLQHKMGDLTCDKLASQVKMLLGGEPVPLILLSDESVTSYAVLPAYEACFDLCLPSDELCWQIQQLLHTLPGLTWHDADHAVALEPAEPASHMDLEIATSFADVDFSLPLPWHDDDAQEPRQTAASTEAATLADLEGNAVTFQQPLEPAPQQSRTQADSLEGPPLLEPAPAALAVSARQQRPTAKTAAAQRGFSGDLHRIERDDPKLVFGSMCDSATEGSISTAMKPVGKNATAEPSQANSSTVNKNDRTTQPTGSLRHRVAAEPKPRRGQPVEPGNLSQQDETAREPQPLQGETGLSTNHAGQPLAQDAQMPGVWTAAGEDFSAAEVSRLGIKKQRPWYYQWIIFGMLSIICLASLDLVFTLHRDNSVTGAGNAATSASDALPRVPAAQTLPQFIPQVAPDAAYATRHPGWERYRADDLEYLVYREHKEIKAVQVLSEKPGAITPAFLKTCIRSSTGHDQFATRKTELRDGIEVTTGTLQNGGEILLYRAASVGDIRGFVLSFPLAVAPKNRSHS